MKDYSMPGTFSNWHEPSRFHWTALPFGFAPRNPTLSLVSRFLATRKRLASIISGRMPVNPGEDLEWNPFYRPLRWPSYATMNERFGLGPYDTRSLYRFPMPVFATVRVRAEGRPRRTLPERDEYRRVRWAAFCASFHRRRWAIRRRL